MDMLATWTRKEVVKEEALKFVASKVGFRNDLSVAMEHLVWCFLYADQVAAIDPRRVDMI